MNESKIIIALNEAKKTTNEEATPAGETTLGGPRKGGMNYLYQCPECGELFYVDTADLGNDPVVCPECGATVNPQFIGTLYDESKKCESDCEDDKEDDDTNEATRMVAARTVVHNGKKVRIKAHKSKKLTGKALAARRKALKKARRKAHTGTANRARAKSMKKVAAMRDNLDIDENAVMGMLNGMIDDVFEHCSEYEPFQVTELTSATYDKSSDKLTLEATVRYNDTAEDDAQFVIEGFKSENLTISESTGIFDLDGLSMTGHGYLSESKLGVTQVGYKLDTDGKTFKESFVLER